MTIERTPLLLILLLGGCSGRDDRFPPTNPVEGTVLADEQPAEGAFVVFHPIGNDESAPRPHGWVGEDGKFRLTSFKANDGAPAGDYVVTIEWREQLDDDEEGPNRLDARFGRPDRSPLRARIEEGKNVVPAFRPTRSP